MAIRESEVRVSVAVVEVSARPDGAAAAAFLAGGIGAFAVGLIVLLNEVGLFTAPTLYAPAGGVSGRTTLAMAVWLVTWVLLHLRWRDREVDVRRIRVPTLVLTGLGILGTFPPLWGVL